MSLISKLKNAIDPPILCLACGSKLKWGTQVGQPSPPSCRNDKCPRYGVCTAVWKEKP